MNNIPIKYSLQGWENVRQNIDAQVETIQQQIRKCNPIRLLLRCNKIAAQDFVDFGDDDSIAIRNEVGLLRAGEYAQAALFSIANVFDGSEDATKQEQHVTEIIKNIVELYRLSMVIPFFVDGIASAKSFNLQDDKSTVFQRVLSMINVRGKRQDYMQRQYHEVLLRPHDGIFRATYGIGADDIIDGLVRLQWSLRDGLRLKHQVSSGSSILQSEFRNLDVTPPLSLVDELFDVVNVTGWPNELAKDLSSAIGSNTDFYNGDFSGWTIQVPLIKNRPFIEINGRVYAFNHFLLTDNFYRALQSAIKRKDLKYDWRERQCLASEKEVSRVFSRILPDAKLYLNNHFPRNGGFKEKGENDLIVIYGDALLIVEVKGGYVDYKVPLEKEKDICRSFQNIDKAIEQCRTTEQYLKSDTCPILYHEDWTEKAKLNLRGIFKIIKMVITVDDVNEFTSCSDALNKAVRDSSGVICVSLDDLHIYERYFTLMPVLFLCYLMERLSTTYIPAIQVYNELDHLAAFISNPCYAEMSKSFATDCMTFINPGSVDELEPYLSAPFNPDQNIKKPLPYLSQVTAEIFDALSRNVHKNVLEISSFLLGMDRLTQDCLEGRVRTEVTRQQMGRTPCWLSMLMRDGSALIILVSTRGSLITLDVNYINHQMTQKKIATWRALGLGIHGKIDDVVFAKSC